MLPLKRLEDYINQHWDNSIVPSLMDYIRIPNKSPHFDEHWEENGHMERAVQHIAAWCRANAAKDMKLNILRLPGRTPLLVMDIPGASSQPILLYGHLDKQPEMTGWREGLGPWTPVLQEGKLYGRGGADDGYAAYASLLAIKALQTEGIPHPRCMIVIEASEESGSCDLPYYMDLLSEQLGQPSLVICLDSGAGNYEQLWMTTSLRGLVTVELTVELLQEGVHSGLGSGIIADSFRVARALISRIEDEATGRILLDALQSIIPEERIQQAEKAALVLDKSVYNTFPLHPEVLPVADKVPELILNRTWRPALTVIGAEGLPQSANAGNVLRPKTSLTLSMRLPPNVDAEKAALALESALTESSPYHAKVTAIIQDKASGWEAPTLEPWLSEAVQAASHEFFGKPAQYLGEGGSIPFMGMLGKHYPKAQFLVTGVLGPHSNAHGPNEFLELAMAKKLTASVAYVIAKLYENKDK